MISGIVSGLGAQSQKRYLRPAFDLGTKSYTAETEEDSETISATAASRVTVSILVNDEAHTDGTPAT